MKLTDIQTELTRQFAALDAAAGGAIVVWHDPDGEFADTVDELDLPGVEVIREPERGKLVCKRAFNEDLSGRCILFYRERARRLDGDWFADVDARAVQFAADYASMQLNTLNATDTPEMRAVLAAHRSFLGKKTVLKKLGKLANSYQTPGQLEGAIIAVALGSDTANPSALLRTYLATASESSGAEALKPLEAAHAADSFRAAIVSWTGYTGELSDVGALAQHILLSALAPHVPTGALAGLERCYSELHAPFCHALFNEWARSDQRDELLALCCRVEEATRLESVLARLDPAALAQTDVFPCIDAIILRGAFQAVAEDAERAGDVLELIAARRNATWYEQFACYYEGALAAARMQRFYREHIGSLAPGAAVQIWRSYTAELYLMDSWYRALHLAFQQAMRAGEYELDEDFRACCDAMEDLYTGWYLRELDRSWIAASEQDLARTGYIEGIPRQLDFAMAEVEPVLHAKKRAWVIVSDALRFEVAAELAEQLERETKGTCELDAVQGIFPTITKCGMAALLPGSSFSMAEGTGGSGGLTVLIDGQEAASTPVRQQVMRHRYPAGIAARYDDFLNKMGRAERRELVGDAEAVYLYHNTVDAIGDKHATERKVFTACAEAIDELVACVQLIVREFSAANVVITADHGFLYTDRPLDEPDHASRAAVEGEIVEAGRRYIVAREGARSEVLAPVALPASSGAGSNAGAGADASAWGADAAPGTPPALVGFTPRECVRIRMAGGGENYVHGGASLQEICVPVLRFTNKRAGSRGYVESAEAGVSLVSQIDTISNSIFTLEFLQDEPVGGKVLPAEYEVFVGDAAHTPVTDVKLLVANRTEADASARRSAISFSLQPGITTSEQELYHLFVRSRSTGALRSLRDLHIRVSFAPSFDFGW